MAAAAAEQVAEHDFFFLFFSIIGCRVFFGTRQSLCRVPDTIAECPTQNTRRISVCRQDFCRVSFAECFWGFAECPWHSASSLFP